jgi:hypothetical protein
MSMRGSVWLLIFVGAGSLALNASFAEQAVPIAAAKTSGQVRGVLQGAAPGKANAEVLHGQAAPTLGFSTAKSATNLHGYANDVKGPAPVATGGSFKTDRSLKKNAAGPQSVASTAGIATPKRAASINGTGLTSKVGPARTGASAVATTRATISGTGMASRN